MELSNGSVKCYFTEVPAGGVFRTLRNPSASDQPRLYIKAFHDSEWMGVNLRSGEVVLFSSVEYVEKVKATVVYGGF